MKLRRRFLSLMLAVAMVASFIPNVVNAVGNEVTVNGSQYYAFEAETNADARAYPNPSPDTGKALGGASGGIILDRFWGAGMPNPWTNWAGVTGPATYGEAASLSFMYTVPIAGDYNLILQSVATKNIVLNLYVNGVRQDLPVEKGGSRGDGGIATSVAQNGRATITLVAGDNVIKIQSTTTLADTHGDIISPDVIYVSANPMLTTIDGISYNIYEAEANAVARPYANPSPDTNKSLSVASGGKILDRFWGIGVNNAWVSWAGETGPASYSEAASISFIHTVLRAGDYKLILQSIATKEIVLNLYVNGIKQDLHIVVGGSRGEASGTTATVAKNGIETITLAAGINTIKIESTTIVADGNSEIISPDCIYISADSLTPISVDKDIIMINPTDSQPVELTAGGKVGQTFTVGEKFNTISLSACTWSSSTSGYTFELRKDRPTGQTVYQHAYSNTVDGSNPVYVVGNLPSGTYYLEINTLVSVSSSKMGLWASQNDAAAYANGTGYIDGVAKTFDLQFQVKSLVTNASAVGNEYVPPVVDKDIIFVLSTSSQPIELTAGGNIGQSFTVAEEFNTISLSVCTWNTAKAGYTFDLRKANSAGEVVYRHAYSNAVDGSHPLYVVGNLPAGTYYLELNTIILGTEVDNTKVSQVGVWASQNDDAAYSSGAGYLNGVEKTFDLEFQVKAIVANAAAVGNEYVAPAPDKDIISFNLATVQPIALTIDGSIGQTFTVAEQFNTISLGVCTWNTSKAGYTFELRKANPTGEIVYRHAYSNAVDGSNPEYVVGNLPAGTYYLDINTLVLGIEVDNTKVSQVGVWASQNDVDAYTGGTAYLDGTAKSFDLAFKVKIIAANSNSVGNEDAVIENPVTMDFGAVQIALMAVVSVAVALRKKD